MARPVLAVALAVAAVLAAAAPAGAALKFERCGGYGFSCARLAVPLDRTGAVPGRVSLHVKRIRARRKPARGAVFVLAGGPGQSATQAFTGDALGPLFAAYARRQLIVYDQRGTGRSGLLRCRAIERANLLDAGRAAADCARRIGARRAFYTSRDSADDIEAIRRELGFRRIVLYGTSYGTKVALAYALRYPRNVERLVLDSVVEANGPNSLYLDTFEAIPRVLRALCRSGCRSFTRDPVADVQALVDRIARGPLRGRVIDSRGRARRAGIDRTELFSVLVAGDFDPSLRAAFPGAVKAALAGDVTPLLRLRRRTFQVEGEPPPPRILSSALYATTTCEETLLPWPRSTPPDPAQRRGLARGAADAVPASAFAPFDRATAAANDIVALCDRWPLAAADPTPGPGPLPDVPVLLLEGEDDLRTPVENARRVAAQFPRSRLLVAPATGHSTLGADPSGCAQRGFDRFLTGRRLSTRCRRVRRMFPVTPPPPRSLAQVPRAAGVPGRRGRAVSAVAQTLRDVTEDAITELIFDERDPDIARGGGLRRGRYRITFRNRLELDHVAYVPGEVVTGSLSRFGTRRPRGALRITGRGTPDGVLTLRGDRVRGRLGGRRLRGRLSPRVTVASARAAAARRPSSAAR
jgi:pimeloyl-ACP methyl ester carboxylesterase